jgi:hypothetical protein
MPQDKQFLPLTIGELPACEICGQRPESIAFDERECRPGCPLKLDVKRRPDSTPHIASGDDVTEADRGFFLLIRLSRAEASRSRSAPSTAP